MSSYKIFHRWKLPFVLDACESRYINHTLDLFSILGWLVLQYSLRPMGFNWICGAGLQAMPQQDSLKVFICIDDFTCAIIFPMEYLRFAVDNGNAKLHFLKVCRSYERLSIISISYKTCTLCSLPIPGIKVKTEDESPQKAPEIDSSAIRVDDSGVSLNPWDLILHKLKIKALVFACFTLGLAMFGFHAFQFQGWKKVR